MLAGFVDGRGRAYDLGFRTLRLSLLDDEGLLLTGPGESVAVQGAVSAALDLVEPRSISLLPPTRGELLATRRRVVFLVPRGIPRREPFTLYRVGLSLHLSAVQHFFTAQGGREFLTFGKADIATRSVRGNALDLSLRGSIPTEASTVGTYRLELAPSSIGEEALEGLE